MTCTTFTLFMHTLSCCSLLEFIWLSTYTTQMGWCYSALGPPGTCVREWGSTVHRCRISCEAHPIKGGWTASPINRSPFQTALCSPTPGSWQQLAARTGHSSPACQSVHYGAGPGEAWEWNHKRRGLQIWSVMDAVESLLPNHAHLTWKLKAGHTQSRVTHLFNPNYAAGDFVYTIVEILVFIHSWFLLCQVGTAEVMSSVGPVDCQVSPWKVLLLTAIINCNLTNQLQTSLNPLSP